MQNIQIPKTLIWVAYYELYDLLSETTKDFAFDFKVENSEFQMVYKENPYNEGFNTLLLTVTFKPDLPDFETVFKNIRDKFGLSMPITFILKNVWNSEKDTLTFEFQTGFFIGKDAELYVFTDFKSLVEKINEIITKN